MLRKIDNLVRRLRKININIELGMNYPWLYLDFVNGKKVRETFWGEHGYTICFLTTERFIDLHHFFKLLRKYVQS
jgi:hypothetical protein